MPTVTSPRREHEPDDSPQRVRHDVCVAHQSPGLWRHPRDQSHRYNDLAYWTAAIWVLAGAVASELDAAHTRGARI